MRTITESQFNLIDAVIAEKDVGGLTASILEKDVHVTEALHALSVFEHKHISLVFCGGTSLSKAHGLIERMSEDVDMKVVLVENHGLSRTAIKSELSELKEHVTATMEKLGFAKDPTGSLVRNENRYVATSWLYGSCYETDISLRPHLSLEFTVRTPQFPTLSKPIAYLCRRNFGREGPVVPAPACRASFRKPATVLGYCAGAAHLRHVLHRAG